MTEPVLVVAWLLLAHLVADFVLQNDWIALNKGNSGRTAWMALLVHGGHVALCLLPAVLAFGVPGLAYLVLVAVSHMAVDRWKVQATRRAEAGAQADARRRIERLGSAPASGLGAAWTPIPGVLFLADQALHATFAVVGWLVILENVRLTSPFVDLANAALRSWDRTAVHAVILVGVVLVSLFIVNTRGGFFFVLSLVSPRDVVGPIAAPGDEAPAPDAGTAALAPAAVQPGWTPAAASVVPVGAVARVNASIWALERLLVVAFLLIGAPVGVGFVIAVELVGRFRSLEDQRFADYYLVGMLASLGVAVGTGLLAQAALQTLG